MILYSDVICPINITYFKIYAKFLFGEFDECLEVLQIFKKLILINFENIM